MSNTAEEAKKKAALFTQAVTTDARWNAQDELMCLVFGYTFYGYLFGVGRLICCMDVEDIQQLAADQLIGSGIGAQNAREMMQTASAVIMDNSNTSLQSQLIAMGQSYFASDDISELAESVFANTEQIRNMQ